MGIFADLSSRGRAILMVTHEPALAEYADRVLSLKDGRVESDVLNRKRGG